MEQGRLLHTIGHSNMGQEDLLDLLSARRIDTVADVRSTPFSRRVPWFNREAISAALADRGMRYIFMGDELGGRPARDDLYGENGRADYERMALEPAFGRGVEALEALAGDGNVAMMCTEHDHLACHRTLLVSRALSDRRNRVEHITRDGRMERHCEAMSRLMRMWKLPVPGQTGATRTALLDLAIRQQAGRIAYRRPAP